MHTDFLTDGGTQPQNGSLPIDVIELVSDALVSSRDCVSKILLSHEW